VTAAHPGVTAKFGVITLTGHVETFFENSAAEQATLARHGDLPMTGMPLHDASDPTRAVAGPCSSPVRRWQPRRATTSWWLGRTRGKRAVRRWARCRC